jgi:hypothetical protein
MTNRFDLDFHGTKFTVTKSNLVEFFLHHPEMSTTTTYEVQSSVPLEIFEVFVKALETGRKILITKENANAVSVLVMEFWLEDLVSECFALEAVLGPDRITALSARISQIENQMSSQVSGIIPELRKSIRNHDRQIETLSSSIEATTITLRREISDVRYSVLLLHGELEILRSTSESQIETLNAMIAAADRRITDSLSLVAPRIYVCEQNLEQMKSTSERQIETLRLGAQTLDRKIIDSVSRITRRVSVCELFHPRRAYPQ